MTRQVNNKLILKNSIMLYIRMFILMIVGFISVRIVLKALGVIDYGIYNVVGGIVAMFQFLQSSLTSASQRYFSIEIISGTKRSLNQLFCLNVTIFMILGVIVVMVCETLGFWFINNKLIIPQERLFAANIVFQLSIISFLINLISIPYNALIISYEKMSAFAWIGLVEGILKLCVAFSVLMIHGDKLIEYGILMTLLTFGVTFTYIIYCKRKFDGCNFHFYWNRKEAKELFSFSGWHFLGSISVVVKSAGVNLMINTFFSPIVNAGRAIGYQVENMVNQFSNNYFTAVKPQMYKAYSMKQFDDLFNLINRSTILSMYLISILAFPLLVNIEFVLKLWLGDVPEYAVAFAMLALVNSLIDATSSPTIAPALAYGKIRNFEIAISFVACMNLPISYFILKMGFVPQSTVVISIILSIAAIFVRAFLLRRMMLFPIKSYFLILTKITVLSVIIYSILNVLSSVVINDFSRLLITTIVSTILLSISYIFVLEKNDRNKIKMYIHNHIC